MNLRTGKGSRKNAPEKNFPPTPKLTLSQTLTLTGVGGLSSGDNRLVAPNPITNPNLGPNSNPN